MAKEIKFTEDELKSLSDLRETYAAVQNDFGAIKVRKVLLTQQLDSLEEAEVQLETRYAETQKTEQETQLFYGNSVCFLSCFNLFYYSI